ncbi:hypothetical protein ACZ87_03165 [Candidatus Erwinia dacicola]|uniref:Uncharacterized protein n=1 Tax=Candidatus Erwinia dacicola TaxID=252393 RepID=A0A328THW1_9GAMM|nr:hypothetical protein ACZ87_03165 [Candidatus Erwinia dacicola]
MQQCPLNCVIIGMVRDGSHGQAISKDTIQSPNHQDEIK